MSDKLGDRINSLIGAVNEYLDIVPVYTRTLAINTPEADRYGQELSSQMFGISWQARKDGQQIASDLVAAGLDPKPALTVVTALSRIDSLEGVASLRPVWLEIETELRKLAVLTRATSEQPSQVEATPQSSILPFKIKPVYAEALKAWHWYESNCQTPSEDYGIALAFIREHGPDDITRQLPTNGDTFGRYVRGGRKSAGEQVNNLRRGRADNARSIVHHREI